MLLVADRGEKWRKMAEKRRWRDRWRDKLEGQNSCPSIGVERGKKSKIGLKV